MSIKVHVNFRQCKNYQSNLFPPTVWGKFGAEAQLEPEVGPCHNLPVDLDDLEQGEVVALAGHPGHSSQQTLGGPGRQQLGLSGEALSGRKGI